MVFDGIGEAGSQAARLFHSVADDDPLMGVVAWRR